MIEFDCTLGFKTDFAMRPYSDDRCTTVQRVSGNETLRLGINNFLLKDSLVLNTGIQDRG
jgi:hypothetical protein